MTGQRTYWHLEGRGRVPNAYEIATTRLLYYREHGFAVPAPIAGWYERYQAGSRLQGGFRTFEDPRLTTYASYVAEQQEREAFAERIVRSIAETDYDRGLDPDWVSVLEAVLPVLRFPCQGLHMLAAYLGHMAPEGRLVVACAFQAMDELRRVQRLAQRMRQLQNERAGFGVDSRRAWQEGSAWQPLRRVLEQLLVTYDFGESAVATLLVLKPGFDALFMKAFAQLAAERGDRLLLELFSSLDQDCRWHGAWSDAFIDVALIERPQNAAPIREWLGRWWPEVRVALRALIEPWGLSSERAGRVLTEIEVAGAARWAALGVEL